MANQDRSKPFAARRATVAGVGVLISLMGVRHLLRGEPDYSNVFSQPVSSVVAVVLGGALFVGAWFLPEGLRGTPGRFPRGWTYRPPEAIVPPPVRARRNDRCPCGSGRKYKRCCLEDDRRKAREDVIARRSGELNRSNEPESGIEMANRGLRGR